jgi:phosphate transport system substrate-binding protein
MKHISSHRIPRILLTLCMAAALPAVGGLRADTVRVRAKVSEALPHYQPKVTVKGTLEIPLTDALADLGDEWTRGFHRNHPDGNLVFLAKTSKEALSQLVTGASNLVIVAREMDPEETQRFQTHFGYLPVRVPVIMDANIVIVNKGNPITAISMQQLDAIYSRTRLGGAPAPALVWGDLGVKGELAKRTINAYTRADGTATRASIASLVLLNGEFRKGILDREDASDLAEAISTDPAGIAIGPLASWFATNKTLPVMPYRGTEARFPSQEMVTTSRYPMPRLYHAYLNRTPGKPVDPVVGEAVNFILCQEGQNLAAEVGLLPGPPEFITMALKRLNR